MNLQGRNKLIVLSVSAELSEVGGGLLGLKTDGGVPLATENWTQNDREKIEFGAKKIDFCKNW